jgi:signal transduction histidine kinase
MRESYTGGRNETTSAHVLLIADSADRERVLRASLILVLPSLGVTTVDADTLAVGDVPAADGAIIDISEQARRGIESFRLLRARGFEGRVVLVAVSPEEPGLAQAVNTLGSSACVARDVVATHPEQLATSLLADAASESPGMRELARTRRVLAAGEATLSLQHAINNPLAALLAEAQLLQLEGLTVEQRASTDRIVELCRRLVSLVRRLDALAAPQLAG